MAKKENIGKLEDHEEDETSETKIYEEDEARFILGI
jgi:hypothetical protein